MTESVSNVQFENQRRTFALDPTTNDSENQGKVNASISILMEAAEELDGKIGFENTILRPSNKWKRYRNNDPSDIKDFLGPWGGYINEKQVVKFNEEAAELEEI